MPLTEKGFVKRTYDEILTQKINRAKELFGADIDTDEHTPLGKYLRINAYDQAEAEEELESIYFSRFINTSSGVSLDRLCAFAGVTRNPAAAASFSVKIVGNPGASVPAGFLLSTSEGIEFYNYDTVIIPESGLCTITAVCTVPGTAGNVQPNEISVIVNPDADITSANGIALVDIGTDTETDVSLRSRFTLAVQGLGLNREAAILAAVIKVSTVESAAVIVNDSHEFDSDGRPPGSFECFVTGGENYHAEIAAAIFDKAPLGVKTVGNIAQEITDSGGYSHTVRFSHTQIVEVTVYAKIKVTSYFPTDGITQIQEGVSFYVNSLGIHADVVFSALYACLHSVPGVADVSALFLSVGGGPQSASNISINETQAARCVSVNVEVINT